MWKLAILTLLFLSVSWGSQNEYASLHEPEPEIDEPEIAVQESQHPISVEVMINGNPATFEAYNIYDRLYFSLEDLSIALEHTQINAAFWFWYRDGRTLGASSGLMELSIRTINGRTHATLEDTAEVVGFDAYVSADHSVISINTNEPYISEAQLQAIVDFLVCNYPQLFTFEMLFEDFGPGSGWWFASTFTIFDIDSGAPGISIRFDDAGSWASRTYMLIDGRYQRIGNTFFNFLMQNDQYRVIWQRLVHDEDDDTFDWEFAALIDGKIQVVTIEDEEELVSADARRLAAPTHNVTEAANMHFWPTLIALPGGIMADARLDSEVIDIVAAYLDYINTGWWTVQEIKKSMILDELVVVIIIHHPHDHESRLWFNVQNTIDGWEILDYQEHWRFIPSCNQNNTNRAGT